MTLSRQEYAATSGGRANQRARTRAALTRAAGDLMREGHAPSMPAAADRALVSVATAYRYFATAEELWEEAAVFAIDEVVDEAAVERAVEAAGDDVEARLEVVVRQIGWTMLDEELRYRQMAKTSLDRWFAQQRNPDADHRPTRPARRNHWNALAVEPLRGTLSDTELEGLVEALGFAWGTEAVIVVYDVLRLDTESAKQRMLTTCRWILHGALADASGEDARHQRPARPKRR
jgi:AcrR family transcriptional regulator